MTNVFANAVIERVLLLALVCAPASALAANLLVNGDFSGGNSGFSTDYSFASGPGSQPGQYDVTTNTQNFFGTGVPSFNDHTSGTGNMMLVDGGYAPPPVVWQETVAVTPNTVFSFDAWARSACCAGGPVVTLGFTANGGALGTLALAGASSAGTWQQFTASVNSGSNTSLTLQVFDQQTNNSVPGNDFALDDLSLTAAVPEPASLTLLAFGLAGIGMRRRAC